MNLSLGAADLKRKSVADFYDSMYKQAATQKTLTEMESPADKFARELTAKDYMTPKEMADLELDIRKDLREQGVAEAQIDNYISQVEDRYLGNMLVYKLPDGKQVSVMPDKVSELPEGSELVKTRGTDINIGERVSAQERAKDVAKMTGSEFSNIVTKSVLERNPVLAELAEEGFEKPNPNEAIYQRRPEELAKDMEHWEQSVNRYVTEQVDEAIDRASTQYLTFEEVQNGWDLRYIPKKEVDGKVFPEGIYKVNTKTKDFDFLIKYSPHTPY